MVMNSKERWYEGTVYVALLLLAALVVFPLLYVLSVSLTPYSEVMKNGGFRIIPTQITWEAYGMFLKDSTIPRAYGVSFFVTIIGTLLNVILTVLMAYPLSKKTLPGRSALLFIVMFTMMFSGGIIPTYLIVKATGLLNSVWSMIIPTAVGTFSLLITKTFFENIPESLIEAARIDGASESRVLVRIILPMSLPVVATIATFYGVMHWNEFFNAVMYITDTDKLPLQVVLRGILTASMSSEINSEKTVPTTTLQMAGVILSALPVVATYPFIQKYFTKGMLVGAVKG
ncbi:carbohydrate ABC transporter permease [Paenibacillus roseipurpureus]|uniref:Carbohydrate ABC transporter permease n=1 Tax=Paenibacillus roseopurpureus TaxID=2918901 RepID=A0AA96LPM3_9BACL|nr:carbohydrate ABC transporter permease [Paenibacillus sp. MBLB1832]WNR45630.1 carbohydrate ABC transporter permease [Paenibacillus sp. MBLB1832]